MISSKALFVSAFSVLLVLCPVQAKAKDPRHGTIVSLQPIENRGDDENESVHKNRRMGQAMGTLAGMGAMLGMSKVKAGSGATTAGIMASSTLPAVGTAVAEKVGGAGPTTRFMVKVRLDSKKVLSITQLRQELGDLREGDRVIVQGTGDEARVQREN